METETEWLTFCRQHIETSFETHFPKRPTFCRQQIETEWKCWNVGPNFNSICAWVFNYYTPSQWSYSVRLSVRPWACLPWGAHHRQDTCQVNKSFIRKCEVLSACIEYILCVNKWPWFVTRFCSFTWQVHCLWYIITWCAVHCFSSVHCTQCIVQI